MRAFTIRSSDIARCPTHRLDVGHYREDGTCKCAPGSDTANVPGEPVICCGHQDPDEGQDAYGLTMTCRSSGEEWDGESAQVWSDWLVVHKAALRADEEAKLHDPAGAPVALHLDNERQQ